MAKNLFHLELDTVASCCEYLGVETLNKYVNIINLDTLGTIKYAPKKIGVYAVVCCWYDHADTGAELHFFGPDYSDSFDGNMEFSPYGWALVFDPQLLEDAFLAGRMPEYTFFSPDSTNMLKLNHDERHMIICCMQSIRLELFNGEDKFTRRIMTAGIAVLLNLCMRYFERIHSSSRDSADAIVSKFNKLIIDYLSGVRDMLHELPTVSSCAEVLHISPNYLGDVVRKKLNCSAQQYIRQMVVKEAAYQLRYTANSIGEIGYNLGFKYPHHFTRVFKQEFGATPQEYRNKIIQYYNVTAAEKPKQ